MFHVHHLKNDPDLLEIHFVFPVGSIQDPFGKEGLSHLVEHLMFKHHNMMHRLESIGHWNASTTHEHTMYYVHTTSKHWQVAINTMFELISSLPDLTEKQLKNEVSIILHEKAEFTIGSTSSFRIEPIILDGTEYSRSIIGSQHSLGNIQLSDIKSHFNTFYQTGFAFIASGGSTTRLIQRHLKQHFSNIVTNELISAPIVYKANIPSKNMVKQARKPHDDKYVKIMSAPSVMDMVSCSIGWKLDFPFTYSSYVSLLMIRYGLQIELFKRLRESMSAAYTPVCKVSIFHGMYIISVKFVCTTGELHKCLKSTLSTAAKPEKLYKTYGKTFLKKINEQIAKPRAYMLTMFRSYLTGDLPPSTITSEHIDIKPYKKSFTGHKNRMVVLLGDTNKLKKLKKTLSIVPEH